MEVIQKRARLIRKLFLILLLNLSDWICTDALLHTGRFFEANPLMRPFAGSPIPGFVVKCLFPIAAVAAIICALRLLNTHELRIADRFISFALVFYIAISLDHTVNFLLLLIFQNSP